MVLVVVSTLSLGRETNKKLPCFIWQIQYFLFLLQYYFWKMFQFDSVWEFPIIDLLGQFVSFINLLALYKRPYQNPWGRLVRICVRCTYSCSAVKLSSSSYLAIVRQVYDSSNAMILCLCCNYSYDILVIHTNRKVYESRPMQYPVLRLLSLQI